MRKRPAGDPSRAFTLISMRRVVKSLYSCSKGLRDPFFQKMKHEESSMPVAGANSHGKRALSFSQDPIIEPAEGKRGLTTFFANLHS